MKKPMFPLTLEAPVPPPYKETAEERQAFRELVHLIAGLLVGLMVGIFAGSMATEVRVAQRIHRGDLEILVRPAINKL